MPVRTGAPRLRFRRAFFDGWAAGRGLATKTQKARFLGLPLATYCRMADDTVRPGGRSVSAVLRAFGGESGVTFGDLFEVVDGDPR